MNTPAGPNPSTHPVIPREQWLAQRQALLVREKELTQLRDQIAAERRALPWVAVDRHYVFDTVDGPRTLADLFHGQRQLLVQHFMFAPGWVEGCRSCSYMADHTDGMTAHLAQRNVSFVAISRAPLADLQAFRQRMGWQFAWVSSHANGFNFDFGVSFTPAEQANNEVTYNYEKHAFEAEDMPGISVFYKDDAGRIFHTYSTYRRGVEAMMGTYQLLDLTPIGRDESPGQGMHWLRHHDRYASATEPMDACCACVREVSSQIGR
jgi:predicted dithiol-disulfide oxidoreductase (DUF899 family)